MFVIGVYQYNKIGPIESTILKSCPEYPKLDCPQAVCPKLECPKLECPPCKNNTIVRVDEPSNDNNIIVVKETVEDPVRNYDYRKAFDPLEDPTTRVPRHLIHPVHIKPMLNIPTRGHPDSYHQLGILIGDDENSTDNKILRLFGRQEFPGSNKHQYYTSISSGNDQIKIPLLYIKLSYMIVTCLDIIQMLFKKISEFFSLYRYYNGKF